MANYFNQIQKFVVSNYPEFEGNVEGGLYPPPKYAEVIAAVTGYVWIGGIAFLLAGDQIFGSLGIQPPEMYTWMKNNKAGAFFGLFMMNNLGHSMLATGAFEIYLNDEVIFSKLQLHRMPSTNDIIAAFATRGFMIK